MPPNLDAFDIGPVHVNLGIQIKTESATTRQCITLIPLRRANAANQWGACRGPRELTIGTVSIDRKTVPCPVVTGSTTGMSYLSRATPIFAQLMEGRQD
jgi:hypothetical protein